LLALPTVASVALVLLLLLPIGSVGSSPAPGLSAGPLVSSLPGPAVLPTPWTAERSPSHAGVAQITGRVDLQTLSPSPAGPAPSSLTLPSTPPAFLHATSGWSVPLASVHASSQAGGVGFEGVNDSQCGCTPPDVIDAAGPTQVVEMVNLWFGVWTKQGAPVRGV